VQLTLEEMGFGSPTSDLPSYVAIEGPIGVGKSTLARALAYSMNYDTLLELPEDNPFLDRFYKDRATYALQTQLSFLFQRTRQLDDIKQADLFQSRRIADFMLEKDPIFAQVTLDEHELELYIKVYEHVVSSAPLPDLVVYLQAPNSVLTERIRARGIASEQHITSDYLERLNNAYMNFFHQYEAAPLLIVNAAEIDFANDPDQYRELVKHILKTDAGRHFYNPVTRDI
jgi:deoxyguanosine kinase